MPGSDARIPNRPDGAAALPQIAGYALLEEIGRGGMGVVYKARQIDLNRTVAVKILHTGRQASAANVRRFVRESEAAARVLHPHIVMIYHAGQAANTYFLVMEFVEGVDLDRLIQDTGPLPVAQACDYIRQAALGLQHAHERGLVHRDIKPTNLMVTPGPTPGGRARGSGREPATEGLPHGQVKILDLGLARIYRPIRARLVSSTLTHEGAFLGTPDFVAPEQAKDPRKVDHRADLYSLGCTFYFLLAGRVPFVADAVSEKLYQHWTAEPAPLAHLRPDVPPDVLTVVRRLMAKRPADRYATAGELAATLAQLAADNSLPANPPVPLGADTATLDATHVLAQPPPGSPGPRDRPELLRRYEGHVNWVQGVAFAPDGQRVLTGSLDASLRLWEVASGRELRRLSRHGAGVTAVAFSPNGRYAVSGAADRTVRVWDVDTGWELRCLTGHTEAVTAVAFLPDGVHVVSAGQDRSLRLWQVDGGQEVRRFVGHRGAVNGLAVAPDGRRLVSAGNDRTLRLWDVDTGQELACLGGQSSTDQGAILTSVALAPDGRHAVTGGSDHVVGLWDVDKGRRLQRLTGHTDWVTCVALSPDGRRVLSGGGDRRVRLWDMVGGQEVCRWSAEASALAFGPDGHRVLLGSRDHSASLWALPS